MAVLKLYTDGACANNQGDENFGGWGAILEYGEHTKELHGGEANTTNNRMELTAVIEGFMQRNLQITLKSMASVAKSTQTSTTD